MTIRMAKIETGLDQLGEGVGIFDQDLHLLYFNQPFKELRNYPDHLCVDGVTLETLLKYNADRGDFGKGSPDQQTAERMSEIRGKEVREIEREMANGIILRIRYVHLQDGGLTITLEDITKEKLSKQALQSSEERYSLVSRASSDGLYDWDLASDDLFVSDRLNQLFAFDHRGVSSRHWANRVHADDFEHYIGTIRQHFKGVSDYLLCEYRIVGKDGKYHWVRDQAVCVRNEMGRAVKLVGAVRDISDQKEAEENLTLAHERFTDGIEAISSGFVLFDTDDRLVVCNTKYIEYFPLLEDVIVPGISMEEIMRAGIERGMFPDALIDPEGWIGLTLGTRSATRGYREQNLNGGLWLQISDHRTKEGGIVSIYTDISELKQRQIELEKAKNQAEVAAHDAEEANRKFKEQNKILITVSDQLAKYISPQLYQSIFRGDQEVKIASKRKKLSIFFSDIANFTEITDQLESEELTSLLNQYLTEMSYVAREFGAYFDKFIGDAMIFYFGDTESKGVKQDANDCVRMAIEMQKRLKTLQTEWQTQGLIDQPFETRIGINTGYCTVGNFGSEERMDYTIIGSEVNLAARLESSAEAGGILLASETYSYVKDWLLAEEQEEIIMKGFPKPVRTYRVKGIYEDLAAEGSVLRSEVEGLTITIDLDQLRKRDKKSAIIKLEEAITQLNMLS